jgi:hypothetical protein
MKTVIVAGVTSVLMSVATLRDPPPSVNITTLLVRPDSAGTHVIDNI